MPKLILNLTAGLTALSWLTLSSPAHAQQSCNYPKGTFDQVYCDAKVLVRADDELNVSYQKLLKRLSPGSQQMLRQMQRAWMAERNSECVSSDGNGTIVYSECAVRKTTERLNFLNDRLRECLSSGCQASKLR